MTREERLKVDMQCGRMDHHVWQVVPGTNNTVRKKVSGGINGAMRFQ